jgi:hypothetical protein
MKLRSVALAFVFVLALVFTKSDKADAGVYISISSYGGHFSYGRGYYPSRRYYQPYSHGYRSSYYRPYRKHYYGSYYYPSQRYYYPRRHYRRYRARRHYKRYRYRGYRRARYRHNRYRYRSHRRHYRRY